MAFEFLWGPLNAALDPVIMYLGPVLFIVGVAVVVSLLTTVAQKLLVDQDRLVYLQKEMKEFQQEMMEARKTNDPQALEKMQKKQMEFMGKQKEMMTMSFKPMIVTMLPILIIFWWIYQSAPLTHLIVNLPSFAYYVLLIPIWHAIPFGYFQASPGQPIMSITWLGWYFLCTFGFSFLFRKVLGVKSGGGM